MDRPDSLKWVVDCRNRAEALRILAEGTHGEVRALYLRLAKTFEDCASLIERRRKTTG